MFVYHSSASFSSNRSPLYTHTCLGIVDRLLDIYPYGYVGPAIEDPIREFSKYGEEYLLSSFAESSETTTKEEDNDNDDVEIDDDF